MPPVLLAAQPAAGRPDPFAGLERFTGHAAGGFVAVGLVLLLAALLVGWAGYDRDPRAVAIAPVLGYTGGGFLVLGACFAAAPGPANFDAVWRLAHWAAYARIGIAVAVLTRRVSRRSGARSWH